MNKKGDGPVTVIVVITIFIIISTVIYPFFKSTVLWFGDLNVILKIFFMFFGIITLFLLIYFINYLYY